MFENDPHTYLIKFQYLGFRYHGWQKQPGVKTIQSLFEKTVSFIFEGLNGRTRAASRTDAMVSAQESYLLLMIRKRADLSWLKEQLNINLPKDIRVLEVDFAPKNFDIIRGAAFKEYHYYFTFGERPHPFCSPLMAHFLEDLDVAKMNVGASLFVGEHNFKNYCKNPKAGKNTIREIFSAEIVENNVLQANFFPEKSYLFRITGKGFMRNQVRLMMGALVELGSNKITLEEFKASLQPENDANNFVAPASGLVLHQFNFD